MRKTPKSPLGSALSAGGEDGIRPNRSPDDGAHGGGASVRAAGGISQWATVLLFLILVLGGAVFCVCKAPDEISSSERRKLTPFPELSLRRVLSGRFFEDFEHYATDQFPMRDGMRRIKALSRYYVFQRLENNGIYLMDSSAIKREKAYSESTVSKNVELWKRILEKNFPSARVYYSVIPDKAAFGYAPSADFSALVRQLSSRAPRGSAYLPLFLSEESPLLGLEDYYRTDLHWRQEAIHPVAEEIARGMGTRIDSFDAYTVRSAGDFYGAYYGQSALPLPPDSLLLCESNATRNAEVHLLRFDEKGKGIRREKREVYDLEKWDDPDRYSVFLSGPEAAIEIVNPAQIRGKSLVVFRDSFASALVPFLISGYERIVLLDLRYLTGDAVELLEIGEVDDVLFLYSATSLGTIPLR